jgi:integrator complex subunit 8
MWSLLQWELPIPLQSMAMALPRGFVQDFAYILLAKSRELTTMKVTESHNCSNGVP